MAGDRLTAREIADQVRGGGRTREDVVEEALAAAVRLDPALHFLERLDTASARAAARRPGPDGPLAGVPFLIKSGTSVETPVVARLVAAGAIPIGVSTRNRPGTDAQTHGWNGRDYTRNPWDQSRSPGGSSAGPAAAVAAGVVPFATGGDSGGSLRIPAAFCGVSGFKRTHGRVPGRPSRLTVAGVIAADPDDLILTSALIGEPFAPASPAPRRIGYANTFGRGVADPAVDAVVRSRVPGAVDVSLTLPPPEQAWDALAALDAGRPVPAATVDHALAVRRIDTATLDDLFREVDVLVTPTTLTVAHPYDGPAGPDFVGDLCWDFNITGHPAVSVPAGLVGCLPAGLQVVAPHDREEVALAVARGLAVQLRKSPIMELTSPENSSKNP
ncbi:amidase [Actinoplanes sp. NPDC051851]|uniref:amidase n=1 Tax=Actinoplanes sp. NPDC051851 TaxID=3154753 RepID=UPI00343AEA34